MDEIKKPTEAKTKKPEIEKDIEATEFINEEVGSDNARHKYVITKKGQEIVFPVSVITKPNFGREEKYFSVAVHPNFPKDYVVDDGNAMLVGIMGKDATFYATLFEGAKDGKPYLGLEIKDKDGYKLQYNSRDGRKSITGFWFSSGERKALSHMGYLELVAIK